MTRTTSHRISRHAPRVGRGRGRTIRWLVLSMLFSALQGVLGAWVVSWIAGGAPVAEICTPQGLQWVRLDAVVQTPDTTTGTGTDDNRAPGAEMTCVWALAHVSLPPIPRLGLVRTPLAADRSAMPGLALARPHGQDGPARVLLMAPMRAPPAPAA
ncbi:MAG: hypothetical protein JNK28_14725 [Burkholderiaceae bacterium]|jgi:hypothetical protein|nr:hypothetical protein [Burkholderiaceae bacterium]